MGLKENHVYRKIFFKTFKNILKMEIPKNESIDGSFIHIKNFIENIFGNSRFLWFI